MGGWDLIRVLWLCNIVLPELCESFGLKKNNFGGWLTGMWHELQKDAEYQLGICLPIRDPFRMRDGEYDNYQYFSFHETSECEELKNQKQRFQEIIRLFRPDIIHIWGTEYMHSLAMVEACIESNLQNQIIVNIQGILSQCIVHYAYGLPSDLISHEINGNSVQNEINDFFNRSKYEKKVFENVHYVIGRTEWDKACTKQFNPDVKYFHCGEILRDNFYLQNDKWDVSTCLRHRIFISQAGYPIKGFHLILDLINRLCRKYPDLQVIVAGKNPITSQTAYGEFISRRIKELHLEKTIQFLGIISDAEMYQQYLKANVFLSPSTIENSSNSVCEAMCVGTPVVSSYVGGIPSIIEHGVSGYMYPLDESYMMEYYIKQIFDNPDAAVKLSKGEIEKAYSYNNKIVVKKTMDDIYKSVCGKA